MCVAFRGEESLGFSEPGYQEWDPWRIRTQTYEEEVPVSSSGTSDVGRWGLVDNKSDLRASSAT